MAIEGFDEALSEDEEKKLAELSAAHQPPEPSSEGEDPDPKPAAEPGKEPAAAEPGKEPGEVTDANADADKEAKESFEEFAAKHKDRSPEELLKLAFQKEQARKTARFDAKAARDVVNGLRDAVQKRAADRAQAQAAEKSQFKTRLAEDPDAAVEEAFDRQQRREREEAEAADWQGYVAAQTQICENVIPRFREVAPQMMQFGVERLGYDPAQVQAAHDSRDMIALYMASQFDRLVQAGIVNFDGSMANGGAAPANGGAAPANAGIPRQAPKTLSTASGGAGGGSKSLKDQAQDLLAMSDADFDKAVASGAFDAAMRGLSGGRQ